ncbi:uncharacterized protein FIBRA_04090 [Fibroporia radiculosa]|uniref:Cytochrome P450 n=1 Tax=Fibroporia radiculosa TaxID=599839 RepID=J4H2S1_9APHY|nr:uncharacterized protein FIBRA_04090 [Fibroporia radiculosa]CCM02014.1 predicted protein [Fibroporia radiculosa]
MTALSSSIVLAASIAIAFRITLHANFLITSATFGFAYVFARWILTSRKMQGIAPGPPLWPVIGNATHIPTESPWLTFSKWAQTYGDIIHLDAMGQPIIILNSIQAAKDLLDKRSSIYSGRPHMVMACDLIGYAQGFVLQPYGEEWRKQRKIVNQDFNQSVVQRYYDVQETQARKLVLGVLNDPSSLESEIKMRIAAIILEANYGYTVQSKDDPFYTIPLDAMSNFSKATAPGAFLVDLIPQLKNLPEWMPGTGFFQTAKDMRKIMMEGTWNPYLWARDNLPTGIAHTPSLCATTLTQVDGPLSAADEHSLVWAGSAVLGGGLDTNMSTILSFVLAMLHYPEIQAKARAEIDAVVGCDRLPSLADKSSLPYVRSIVTEVYRWAPPVPLCIPHCLNEDDVYNGIHLPKGSLVMPNIWHMTRDPNTYPNPDAFQPERYDGSDIEMQKVTDLVFGFGRRVCPGIHFAQGTIFAIISTLLATCEILPTRDAHGRPVIPEVAYTSSTICFPKNVQAHFTPRTPQAMSLLTQSIVEQEFVVN